VKTDNTVQPITLPQGAVFFAKKTSVPDPDQTGGANSKPSDASFKAFTGKPQRLS
jgi:hypothetical protein